MQIELRPTLGEFPEEPFQGTLGHSTELWWDMGLYGGVDIQKACDRLYGEDVQPHPQFTTLHKYRLGGPDPLDYCNAYSTLDGKCWHYVSMGFTNLHRELIIPHRAEGLNGFGFELTMRVSKIPGQQVAPLWPWALMQSIARHCFESGRGFATGHVSKCTGNLGPDSTMSYLVFAADPQMESSVTSRGRVDFLTMVGVTKAELDAAIRMAMRTGENGVGGFVEILKEFLGEHLPTDLKRTCLMENPNFVDRLEEVSLREGEGEEEAEEEEAEEEEEEEEEEEAEVEAEEEQEGGGGGGGGGGEGGARRRRREEEEEGEGGGGGGAGGEKAARA